MMQDNGRKAQALDNYPSLINDPEICRLRLELARQARKMDPDSWKKHFEETISKRHLVAVVDCNHGRWLIGLITALTHTGGILNIRTYRRPPTRHKGIDYRLQSSAPGVISISASISTLNTLFKITSTLWRIISAIFVKGDSTTLSLSTRTSIQYNAGNFACWADSQVIKVVFLPGCINWVLIKFPGCILWRTLSPVCWSCFLSNQMQ